MKLYCYFKDCFIGIMYIGVAEKKMEWVEDEQLSEQAKHFKSLLPLNSSYKIDCFISERVADRRRPGVDVWLSQIGCNLQSTDEEIFVKNHGYAVYDMFWCTTERDDDSLWKKFYV